MSVGWRSVSTDGWGWAVVAYVVVESWSSIGGKSWAGRLNSRGHSNMAMDITSAFSSSSCTPLTPNRVGRWVLFVLRRTSHEGFYAYFNDS